MRGNCCIFYMRHFYKSTNRIFFLKVFFRYFHLYNNGCSGCREGGSGDFVCYGWVGCSRSIGGRKFGCNDGREGWLQLVLKKDVVAQISCFVVVEKGMVDLVEVEVDGLQEGMVVAMQLVEEGKVVIEVGWIHVMLEKKMGLVLVVVVFEQEEVVEGDVVMVQEEPVVEVEVVVGLGLGSWLEQRRCFITG